MREVVEKVKSILAQTPPDWQGAEALIVAGKFTKAELAYLAQAITDACFCEYRFLCYDHKEIAFEKMNSTYLLRSLKLLLKHGMDPNYIYEGENVLWNIKYIDFQDVGPSAMRLLLEHGGDPNLKDPEGSSQSLLDAIITSVEYDEFTHEFAYVVKCMLVLLAFGAPGEDDDALLTMKEGYDVTIFKRFEKYFYEIEALPRPSYPCYGYWRMHLYEKETNIEVATWE
jgi:hypothetical protein